MQDDTQVTGNSDAPAQDAQPTADTATTQTNEADVQVTNETPEATQDKQGENKSLEVSAEDTAPEERLYAGKYKSVEEMEKAYGELNSKATRDAQEKAELARILNESFSTPEPQAQQQQDDGGYDEYQQPDPVAQKLDKLEQAQTVQNFIFAHPDADGKSMNEVLSGDPLAQTITDYNARLEYAYLKSQNMSSTKAIAEVKKQTANATQAKIVEKQAAQVESARKADESSAGTELYDKATGNYTEAERTAARKELIKKHLVNL